MARKSITKINLGYGVSILALVGLPCGFCGPAQAAPASVPTGKPAVLDQAQRKNIALQTRTHRRVAAKEARWRSTRAGGARSHTGSPSERVQAAGGVALGSARPRVHRVETPSRGTPGKATHGQAVGHTRQERPRMAHNTVKILNSARSSSATLRGTARRESVHERMRRGRPAGGKPGYFKYKLERATVKSWSTSGAADSRPATRYTGSWYTRFVTHTIKAADEPALFEIGLGGADTPAASQMRGGKKKSQTKGEGGRHTPFFGNYRPQFYLRTGRVAPDNEGEAGTYHAKFFLRPHYQLERVNHNGVLTSGSRSTRNAMVTKPRILILDEPAPARDAGFGHSVRRPHNFAVHGTDNAATDGYVSSVDMLPGTISDGGSGGTDDPGGTGHAPCPNPLDHAPGC